MSTFHLKIIAYDKIFYDEEAASVVLPAIDGEVQILTNHEECVVALKTGEVRIGTPKGEMIPAVCGSGFAEVTSDNQVEILVDTIERPEEIDIRRAKEAKERAEERLLQHKSRMEYYRNTTSLARAMARLKEANNYVEIHRIPDALHGYFALGIRFLHVQESFEIMNRFLNKS